MALGGIVHADIQFGEHVGAAVDATLSTEQHTLAGNLLRSDKHGKVGAMLHLVHDGLEVDGVGRRVLEAHYLLVAGYAGHRVGSEADFDVAGHVVEKYRQRQLGHQFLVELSQFGLTGSEVVGWGTDHAVGSVVGSLAGQSDALLDAGVGDAGQQWQASAVDAARLFNHLLAYVVRQALFFARSTQHKESVYATGYEVFYQSLEALDVECLVVFQRGYQRWDDTAQGFLETRFHII